jgi:hypothetical protein
VGHAAAPEAPQEGRPCSGRLDKWLYYSPPERGGDSIEAGHMVVPEASRALERGNSYLTCGCSGALLGQEASPRVMGYMVACHCMTFSWS